MYRDASICVARVNTSRGKGSSEMRDVRTCLWLVSGLRILSAAYKPLLLSEKRDSNNENIASNKRFTTQI